jgi:hypothetical protein
MSNRQMFIMTALAIAMLALATLMGCSTEHDHHCRDLFEEYMRCDTNPNACAGLKDILDSECPRWLDKDWSKVN